MYPDGQATCWLAVGELVADVNRPHVRELHQPFPVFAHHLQQPFLFGFRDLLHVRLPLDRSGATIVEHGGEEVNA
jgi:hypothetical protein